MDFAFLGARQGLVHDLYGWTDLDANSYFTSHTFLDLEHSHQCHAYDPMWREVVEWKCDSRGFHALCQIVDGAKGKL